MRVGTNAGRSGTAGRILIGQFSPADCHAPYYAARLQVTGLQRARTAGSSVSLFRLVGKMMTN